jgi:hypothetical protein
MNIMKINILNNTLNGGGYSTNAKDSYCIYAYSGTIWNIDPLIINNVILGYNGNIRYGIYLDNSSPNLKCIIHNNLFNPTTINYHFAITGAGDITNRIDWLNGSLGDFLFETTPELNLSDNRSPLILFTNWENNNYHFSITSTPAQNNGHNGSYNSLYSEEGAMFDIDGEPRPADYSKIDLGADEFYFGY